MTRNGFSASGELKRLLLGARVWSYGPLKLGIIWKYWHKVAPTSVASSSSATVHVADPKEVLEEFVEEWVQTLDQEDKGLAMLLCSTLVNELSFTETRAVEFAARIIHKSDRSVRQWCTDLISNNGTFPESKQGTVPM